MSNDEVRARLAGVLNLSPRTTAPDPDVILPAPSAVIQQADAPPVEDPTEALRTQAAELVKDGVDPDVAMAQVGLGGHHQEAVMDVAAQGALQVTHYSPRPAPPDVSPEESAYRALIAEAQRGPVPSAKMREIVKDALGMKRLRASRLDPIVARGVAEGVWIQGAHGLTLVVDVVGDPPTTQDANDMQHWEREHASARKALEKAVPEDRGGPVERSSAPPAPKDDPETDHRYGVYPSPRSLLVLVDCVFLDASGLRVHSLESLLAPFIQEVEEECGVQYYRLLQYNAGPSAVIGKFAAALHQSRYKIAADVILVESRHPCASEALGFLQRVPGVRVIRRY